MAGGELVTTMVQVGAPGAVTVIVPVLIVVPVLAVVLSLKDPLPVRLAGTKVLTVSHAALLVTVQVLLEVTLIVAELATLVGFHVAVESVSVPGTGACVTVIVRVGAPGAVAVMVPVLAAVPVLAVALSLKDPLPVRFAGTNVLIVSHAALLVTVHVLL